MSGRGIVIAKDRTSKQRVFLPKSLDRPNLAKYPLEQVIGLVSTIALGSAADRTRDTQRRVCEYCLSRFAGAEGRSGKMFEQGEDYLALA